MLCNRLLIVRQVPAILQPHRSKASSGAGQTGNLSRQSKILGKFFGSRLSGSKKRWYPGHEGSSNTNHQPAGVAFQSSQHGKSSASLSIGSKHNARRMSVLNKLFMTHIADLLASGQISEIILGRSLQVTRVKISPDFSCINVYWMADDINIDAELQRCSGQVRHQLSQLRLMGEVPRIKFVHDKSGSNLDQVEAILLSLNQPLRKEPDNINQSHDFDVAQTLRQEFYGQKAEKPSEISTSVIPQMRHDVLGLDHRFAMDKILSKMRKSKQAWEQHYQQKEQFNTSSDSVSSGLSSALRPIGDYALSKTDDSKFELFLAKRRHIKSTPERKIFRREQEQCSMSETASTDDHDNLQLLSPEQRLRYTQEDYIVEEKS